MDAFQKFLIFLPISLLVALFNTKSGSVQTSTTSSSGLGQGQLPSFVVPFSASSARPYGGTCSDSLTCNYREQCEYGKCVQRLNKPVAKHRAPVTQMNCTSSQLIALSMAYDDRRALVKKEKILDTELSAIQYLIDCYSDHADFDVCDGPINLHDLYKWFRERRAKGGMPYEKEFKYVGVKKTRSCYVSSGGSQLDSDLYNLDLLHDNRKRFTKVELQEEVRKRGSTIVHLKVYPEIFAYSSESDKVFKIRPTKSKFVGYHSVTVEGYEDNNDEYFVLKNSWGKEFGIGGYMYIEANTLFDYYLADTNIVSSGPTAVLKLSPPVNNFIERIRKILPDMHDWKNLENIVSHRNKRVNYSKEIEIGDLNKHVENIDDFDSYIEDDDLDGDFPKLRLALRCVREYLSRCIKHGSKLECSNGGSLRQVRIDYVIHADMSVVAGRRFYVIVLFHEVHNGRLKISSAKPEHIKVAEVRVFLPFKNHPGDPSMKEIKSNDKIEAIPSSWWTSSFERYIIDDHLEWSVDNQKGITLRNDAETWSQFIWRISYAVLNRVLWLIFWFLVASAGFAFAFQSFDDQTLKGGAVFGHIEIFLRKLREKFWQTYVRSYFEKPKPKPQQQPLKVDDRLIPRPEENRSAPSAEKIVNGSDRKNEEAQHKKAKNKKNKHRQYNYAKR